MIEQSIRNNAQVWYTLGRRYLPRFGTDDFYEFAGKSAALAFTVNPFAPFIHLQVSDQADTAYVDLNTNTIAVSAKYFSPELYVRRFGPSGAVNTEEIAIALVNGSIIHEALHIQYTARDDYTERGEKRDLTIPSLVTKHEDHEEMIKRFGKNTVYVAFNIFEDLFIESHVPDRLAGWLWACSDIIFSREDLDGFPSPPVLMRDALNLAISYKNPRLRDHVAFTRIPEAAANVLRTAVKLRESATIRDRIELAFRYLDAFADMADPTNDMQFNGMIGAEGADDEMGVGESMKRILDEVDGPTGDVLERAKRLLEGAASTVAAETSKFKSEGDIRWVDPVEADVMDLPVRSIRVWPTVSQDYGFMRDLVAMRTINRVPGEARDRGSVMVKTRLHRIATDGKIYAKYDADRQRAFRIEIIILIDFSGSTSGETINAELGAAKEISKVLRSANIAHSVYGHTSDTIREEGWYIDTPLLFHIFSHDMSQTNTDWEARFERARTVYLSENYDGVILDKLGEKFTGRRAARYIINLSDGRPAAPGYSGHHANEHTRRMINKLRDHGIGVFAVSVVKSVVVDNDRIYGSDYNLDASRDLPSQFRGLVKRLVDGRG